MKPTVEVIGDEELARKLRALDDQALAALLKAGQAGADVIEADAERRAPGPNIETEVMVKEPLAVEIGIGPDDEHWYYRFFEYGAVEHEIKAVKKQRLRFEGEDGEIFMSRVKKHPGMTAEPFLRSAFDQKKDEAVTAVGKVLERIIDRITRL